jgi:hypothetical protein
MAGEVMCCLFCGRDTKSKSGACSRCEGGHYGRKDSHYKAIDGPAPPKACWTCGREHRFHGRFCQECGGMSSEDAYHGGGYCDIMEDEDYGG